MEIAILFWCYKDPVVCADRVRLIRHHNPSSQIYVLYGGDVASANGMQEALGPFVNDFWKFDLDRSAHWKWKNGDRVIARWYLQRGTQLVGWTHLFVAQWDMLLAAPLGRLLEEMPDDAAVFSGRLKINDCKNWWSWVRGRKNRLRLLLFRIRLFVIERYFGPIFSAPFIIVCAPRSYFERLAMTLFAEAGYIEYRCPTFAACWGFVHWSSQQLEAWRPTNPRTFDVTERERIISASKAAVRPELIRSELKNPEGFRVFHPVHCTDIDAKLGDLPYKAE